jgi:hypothetical protein
MLVKDVLELVVESKLDSLKKLDSELVLSVENVSVEKVSVEKVEELLLLWATGGLELVLELGKLGCELELLDNAGFELVDDDCAGVELLELLELGVLVETVC